MSTSTNQSVTSQSERGGVDPKYCECSMCGYSWQRGQDGSHRCSERLLESRNRLRAKIDLLSHIQHEGMPEPWRTRVCNVIANGSDSLIGLPDQPQLTPVSARPVPDVQVTAGGDAADPVERLSHKIMLYAGRCSAGGQTMMNQFSLEEIIRAELAADHDALRERVTGLEGALGLLWDEVVLSGNAYSKDFGWTAAREATLRALAGREASRE